MKKGDDRAQLSVGKKYHNAVKTLSTISSDVNGMRELSEVAIVNLILQSPKLQGILKNNNIELDFSEHNDLIEKLKA